MKTLLSWSFISVTQTCLKLFKYACVAVVAFLYSCSSVPSVERENITRQENDLPLLYSMVFIIHGDGDYLYYDYSGLPQKADEETLAGAINVAMRNPQAEVFIFHEKPVRHAFLFFPLHDGEFYYFRHGRLFARESYWREQVRSRFYSEMELYQLFRAKEQTQMSRLFLYFGHEIPEFGGAGYDASYPDRTFTINDLAEGLGHIVYDTLKLDLIVLSTCFNGTPYSIAALAPYARTIVASPDNLHLSYFDIQSFEHLEIGLQDKDISAFAIKSARRSFDRLAENIHTAVTVAVYDAEGVRGYLDSVKSIYNNTLSIIKGLKPESASHCDCAEEPAYILPGISKGVDIFYRPPRFGRLKNNQNHSGWECWTLKK